MVLRYVNLQGIAHCSRLAAWPNTTAVHHIQKHCTYPAAMLQGSAEEAQLARIMRLRSPDAVNTHAHIHIVSAAERLCIGRLES